MCYKENETFENEILLCCWPNVVLIPAFLCLKRVHVSLQRRSREKYISTASVNARHRDCRATAASLSSECGNTNNQTINGHITQRRPTYSELFFTIISLGSRGIFSRGKCNVLNPPLEDNGSVVDFTRLSELASLKAASRPCYQQFCCISQQNTFCEFRFSLNKVSFPVWF